MRFLLWRFLASWGGFFSLRFRGGRLAGWGTLGILCWSGSFLGLWSSLGLFNNLDLCGGLIHLSGGCLLVLWCFLFGRFLADGSGFFGLRLRGSRLASSGSICSWFRSSFSWLLSLDLSNWLLSLSSRLACGFSWSRLALGGLALSRLTLGRLGLGFWGWSRNFLSRSRCSFFGLSGSWLGSWLFRSRFGCRWVNGWLLLFFDGSGNCLGLVRHVCCLTDT